MLHTPHPIDARIAVFAARQHGIVTTAQMRASGIDATSIHYRVQARRLFPLHRGVFAVGYPTLSDERRWMAAVLSAGPGAALARTSAARLWRIWRGAERGTTIVAPRRRRARAGVTMLSTRQLQPRDVTVVRGIAVTSVARTIVDLADVLDVPQVVNVMHEAAYRGQFSEPRIVEAAGMLVGRRRVVRIDDALAAYRAGSAGTRSRLEDRFLRLVRAAGMQSPAINTRVTTRARTLEVDFVWLPHRLCVEVDGPGHDRPRVRASDAVRDELLRDAGYRVMRVTHAQLAHDGGRIIRRLHRELGVCTPHEVVVAETVL